MLAIVVSCPIVLLDPVSEQRARESCDESNAESVVRTKETQSSEISPLYRALRVHSWDEDFEFDLN